MAAATDAASWDVTAQQDLTLSGLDATAIAATATAASAGIPVGTSRYAYLVNVGSSGTVTMWTTGTVGEGEFANDSTDPQPDGRPVDVRRREVGKVGARGATPQPGVNRSDTQPRG